LQGRGRYAGACAAVFATYTAIRNMYAALYRVTGCWLEQSHAHVTCRTCSVFAVRLGLSPLPLGHIEGQKASHRSLLYALASMHALACRSSICKNRCECSKWRNQLPFYVLLNSMPCGIGLLLGPLCSAYGQDAAASHRPVVVGFRGCRRVGGPLALRHQSARRAILPCSSGGPASPYLSWAGGSPAAATSRRPSPPMSSRPASRTKKWFRRSPPS
jgi:hypothetical protein